MSIRSFEGGAALSGAAAAAEEEVTTTDQLQRRSPLAPSSPPPHQTTAATSAMYEAMNRTVLSASSAQSSSLAQRSPSRKRYDVAGTMDRLRSSLVGESSVSSLVVPPSEHQELLRLDSRNDDAVEGEDTGLLQQQQQQQQPPTPPYVGRRSVSSNNGGYQALLTGTAAATSPGASKSKIVGDRQEQEPPLDLALAALPAAPASSRKLSARKSYRGVGGNALTRALGQVPADALIGMIHLMIGIPFGVSYFPVGWRSSAGGGHGGDGDSSGSGGGESTDEDPSVQGPFPLPGKEALGIRMFLFSTVVGQIVFTFTSKFHNPIGLQMVENVGFQSFYRTCTICCSSLLRWWCFQLGHALCYLPHS